MTASLWLVAGLACASSVRPRDQAPRTPTRRPSRCHRRPDRERCAPPRPAASKIVAVTVYQGQALVTREVSVPEGEGTVELVVTPLPAQAVDSSLYTEGTDGLRVLSTRFRTRAVKDDTRQEVRAKEELLKKLQADAQQAPEGDRRPGAGPPVPPEARGVHRHGPQRPDGEGPARQRGRSSPSASSSWRAAARRRRPRPTSASSCRPTPRRPSSPGGSSPSCPPARAGSSATP